MARRIIKVQTEKEWTRYKALAHFKISPATFCRWRAGLNGPNVDAYIRVMKKLEEHEAAAAVAKVPAEKPASKKPVAAKGK